MGGMNARFRGYFQALMSSAKVLFCHPRSLFHRSDSKSSLDIGVRPIRPMYAGVVRMEMHNINNHSPNLARRSRPQHLINGTGTKTASKGRRQGQLNGDAKAVKTNPAPDRPGGKSRKNERKNSGSSKNIFRIGLHAPEPEISNVHS